MKYNCYILDDEPLAIQVIEQYLAKLVQFNVIGKSTDPIVAFEEIKASKIDLLFLDIEMPQLSGLELLESLSYKPEIVITTAYREYAVEGFDHDVLDYLVKPFPFNRFLQSIDRFLNKKGIHDSTLSNRTDVIYVRADRKEVKIRLDEILYIEGLKDYSRIILKDRQILTKTSIGNFQSELPSNQFIRVHKSFVVALDKITAYTAHDVELEEIEIPIGRTYKEEFRKRIKLL